MNVVDEADDRLSSLTDDLIHKILCFISIKQAIRMSILSSRWRFIWTSLPYLHFTKHDRCKFVTHVLSRRNTQTEASSVKFWFGGKISLQLVKHILDYAFSRNVQQMMIVLRDYRDRYEVFPLSFFISRSLKHLTIAGHRGNFMNIFLSTWELPALTTLHLKNIRYVIDDKSIGIFSKYPNLKNLTLKSCHFESDVEIYHPGLLNLTLENGDLADDVLNVVTPQLKNLVIREWSRVHLVSAPELTSLRFKGSHLLQISQKGLCSLETVDLCIYNQQKSNEPDPHKVVSFLQQLHNAKSLTLNLEIIQILSTFVNQPSPFENLKSLKIYPHNASLKLPETLPIEVRKYLLDGSPSAIFTMVSCKEIIGMKNAISAEKCIAELQVMLEKENSPTETHMYRGNAPMEYYYYRHVEKKKVKIQPVAKMKQQITRMMSEMERCWNDVGEQIRRGNAKTYDILSKLQSIEELLLEELPASKRDKLQTCFSSLREEVDTVVKNITDGIKIQQSRLSDRFHHLPTISQMSS